MDKILHQGKIVALHVRSIPEGTTPVSDHADAVQLLALKHKKGKLVAPHTHKPTARTTQLLQEALVVMSGKLRVTLFDADGGTISTTDVSKGETFITLDAGHSIEFLEDSEVLEFKNGPYLDDKVILST